MQYNRSGLYDVTFGPKSQRHHDLAKNAENFTVVAYPASSVNTSIVEQCSVCRSAISVTVTVTVTRPVTGRR